MLEVYLIRHGESELNVDSKIFGIFPRSPLTKQGERQAKLLGRKLEKDGVMFDVLYCSTAKRSYQTALELSKLSRTREIIKRKELSEIYHGDWNGKVKKKVMTPEIRVALNSDNWNFRPSNGESQKDVEDRMYKWFSEVCDKAIKESNGKDYVIGAVSHAMSIKCFLRKFLEFPASKTYTFAMDASAVNRLQYNPKYKVWFPLSINDTSHLYGSKRLD